MNCCLISALKVRLSLRLFKYLSFAFNISPNKAEFFRHKNCYYLTNGFTLVN